jgi:hypothetical protein
VVIYNLKKAKKAIEFLVEAAHYESYKVSMKKIIAKPRALPYRDDKEVLNELIVIGRQSMLAFNNLLEVVEHKRSTPEERKNEYQKEFMAAKRRRDSAFIKLCELEKGKRLGIDERHNLLVTQHKKWEHDKLEYIALHGDVSWKDRNVLINQFWETKDEELAQQIHEIEYIQKTHAANKLKKPIVVQPTKRRAPAPTRMELALKNAVDKRK